MAVVVALLAPAPATAGVSAAYTRTLTAPYTGALVTPSGSWAVSGCSQAAVVKAAFFHPATGHGGLYDSAAAWTCARGGSSFSGSSAYASGGVGVTLPLSIYASRTHSIAVQWSVSAAGFQNLKPGTCSLGTMSSVSCSASAYVYLYAYAYLVDNTDGSYYWASNYWSGLNAGTLRDSSYYSGVWYNTSSGNPGAFLLTSHPTFWINASLEKGDSYTLSLEVYGSVSTSTSGWAGSKADASLNMATLGNGADLTSVTVT